MTKTAKTAKIARAGRAGCTDRAMAAAAKASAATAKRQTVATKRRAAAAKANDSAVTNVVNTKGGDYVMVSAGNGDHFLRPRYGDSKEFRANAAVGQPYAAALKWHNANPPKKPVAKLASGISAKDAPQSAKAVADQAKAAPATGKNGKARTAKAAANKQPARGTDRTYKLAGRKDESKPDTFRRYMLSTIMAHTSTADAKAAHAKSGKYPTHKLDFNWTAQQGYIAFTK